MFGSLPNGLLSVAQPLLGHLGVVRVNDLAELRELGEQGAQVAVWLGPAPPRGHRGVVRVNDLAELRELGEQGAQVAVLLAALEHADRLQRAVRPSAQQANVGETGLDPWSRTGAELLA